eukprot:TRINITY_DN73769_c0_g1_i1.p1 TRINITY_DN73769_c0_g1~~TRINITY_DN73769_c0_g1_i1.p1  ORF type:complete len:277 (+),score=23.55 TRINITY_DN73769_c0_g1_i1:221-1051(+)
MFKRGRDVQISLAAAINPLDAFPMTRETTLNNGNRFKMKRCRQSLSYENAVARLSYERTRAERSGDTTSPCVFSIRNCSRTSVLRKGESGTARRYKQASLASRGENFATDSAFLAKVRMSCADLCAMCHQVASVSSSSPIRSQAVVRAELRVRFALERLRKTLQAMPRTARELRIARLDVGVRAALLGFMEGLSTTAPTAPRKSADAVGLGHCTESEQYHRQETCSLTTLPKVTVLPSSGVAGVHKGKRGMYRAKISVSGIILYSRYSTLEDAICY